MADGCACENRLALSDLGADSDVSQRRARVPNVLWAERKDKLFITVEVPDCKDAKVDITEEGKLSFTGKGGTDDASYACEIQLMKPVDSKAGTASQLALILSGLSHS